jgi:tetratricopeptide (TPR) repeat protein
MTTGPGLRAADAEAGRRMRRVARLARLALAGTLMLGASAAQGEPEANPPDVVGPPSARPAPPPAPAPVPPALVASLAAAHRAKAVALEREGQLQRALDEWKIALTIAPGDPEARAGKQALEARIEEVVAERLRQGREALVRGAHLDARRHFLAVLAVDPGNARAFEALRTDVREVRIILHTVRRGETLAGLAERYYGDRIRADVIARSNQLTPSQSLVVGTALKVPEIPGAPFLVPEARRPAAPVESPELSPLIIEAREALDRGDYLAALADVDRVLGGSTPPPEALDLKKAILYGLGKSQLEQRKYMDSYDTLTRLARLAPSYQDAPTLLRQVRDRLVQQHYSEGLRLYREERIEEAIAEWRLVLELDPHHSNTQRNLEQAERLLRGLRERQRTQTPGG